MKKDDSVDHPSWSNDVSVAYYAFVLKVAVRVAPCPDLIEDIAQQAIVEFLSHPDRWKEEVDPRPLLAKITRDVAALHRRRLAWTRPDAVRRIAEKLLRRPVEESFDDGREEAVERLHHCMKELPPHARDLLKQYYVNRKSHEEIAAMNSQSGAAVSQALFRIRNLLRRCIRKRQRDE